MPDPIRFPKTPRLAEVLERDLHQQWKRHTAVVEEKVDGANVALWVYDGDLILQSRNEIVEPGDEAPLFATFPSWAEDRRERLETTLGTRYAVFGEWCWGQNKSFYDALPDLVLGFDVLDREANHYLPSKQRDAILKACGVSAVPHLWSGKFGSAPAFTSFIGKSRLKTARWRDALQAAGVRAGVKDPLAETDNSDDMEGVYVRIENDTQVLGRMKVHRPAFTKVRNDSWGTRPSLCNMVRT